MQHFRTCQLQTQTRRYHWLPPHATIHRRPWPSNAAPARSSGSGRTPSIPKSRRAEELAALDPDLHAALFGPRDLPFSITLVFPRSTAPTTRGPSTMARESAEYREVGTGDAFRHRARFFPAMRCGCAICSRSSARSRRAEVLIDDRPIPYARELWLPLVWFLLLP